MNMQHQGSITWTVTVSSTGFYDLIVGFYTNGGNKNQDLQVNGNNFGEVAFQETSGFTSLVAAKKIKLNSGQNKIAFVANWGYQLFDYIEIDSYTDVPFDISGKPVTPGASAQSLELYAFLRSNFEKKTISGVMTLQGNDQDSFRENDYVHENSGKYPALIGLDFLHQAGLDTEWYTDDSVRVHMVVRDAKKMYDQGGIPALCWHWRDPSHKTIEFYSPSSGNDYTEFDAAKAADETSQEYQYIIRDLDIIAAELKLLDDDGIPCTLR